MLTVTYRNAKYYISAHITKADFLKMHLNKSIILTIIQYSYGCIYYTETFYEEAYHYLFTY